MSGNDIVVELQKRENLGKGLATLRHQGIVPAVVHDHGKPSIHVMGSFIHLTKAYQAAGKHHTVNLTVEGDKHLAMIKDVDFDPVKHTIRHIVFQAIKQNETVSAEVPVHLDGEIPAVRAGLMVITQLDHVVIEALPKNLIDEIKVDATKLVEVGDSVTVGDIVVPSGVTIMDDPNHPIATVEESRAQKDEASEAATEAAAAEVPAEHGSVDNTESQ